MMITYDDVAGLEYEARELIVLEALLRRIALVNMPFVLKGSLLTRQYLDNREIRDADDIDLLYAGKIRDVEHAHEVFTQWMIQVTEMDLNDGVVFRSFRENAFWRYIDYAMADDFPTINTDIAYYFKGQTREADDYSELDLDISFNLEMDAEPVPLQYQPAFGESFLVPYTVPLSIQVAWKLHQTIVRPRFKDLYDLKFLLSHPTYDNDALKETLQALVNECSIDPSIKKADMKKVLVDDLQHIYDSLSYDYDLRKYAGSMDRGLYFTQFVSDLRKKMDFAGINGYAFESLPSPTLKKL
ncbi:nucleotidyl transferase AbiEii/AbiGii toxin family protein [Brevibacillus formosus]|uniref:nucleotidyl transferase AbiEii/AbiGii toxin family protein n=1 Tax=Brevibacillus formosus TaxID=54913 RepID=UPI002155C7A6|nr:nucleotidyl transferase AbiEii/AbiGii toxin family protein [Brevibacillus formosus]